MNPIPQSFRELCIRQKDYKNELQVHSKYLNSLIFKLLFSHLTEIRYIISTRSKHREIRSDIATTRLPRLDLHRNCQTSQTGLSRRPSRRQTTFGADQAMLRTLLSRPILQYLLLSHVAAIPIKYFTSRLHPRHEHPFSHCALCKVWAFRPWTLSVQEALTKM
jgi:hypothetical protein